MERVSQQTRIYAILSPLAQMWRAKGDVSSWQMLLGGMRTLGIDLVIMMTMQPSLTTMKTVTACEQAFHLRNNVRSHARVASERTGGSRCGKKSESFSFLPRLTASSLTRAFACHSKWRGWYQSITFLSSPASSLFDEPVYVSNSDEKFKLVTY